MTQTAAPQSVDVKETVELNQHQWNVLMGVLRVDTQDADAATRLGDVASQAESILTELQKQLHRDGVERH